MTLLLSDLWAANRDPSRLRAIFPSSDCWSLAKYRQHGWRL